MTDEQFNPQSPIDFLSFMESLTPMPVSDKFRGKDFSVLLILEDRENAKYEMIVRNQKLEILQGEQHKPDISIIGFEDDFIKVFHKMDPYNYAVLKIQGPILKHMTLSTLIGEINLFLEKRNQPNPEIGKVVSQNESVEEVNYFTPIITNAKASELWSDTLASIRINFFKETLDRQASPTSTLEKLSKMMLTDAYLNNMSTGGMSADTYSAALKKVVMPEIHTVKDEFIAQKEKNGNLGSYGNFHLDTQNRLSLGDTSAKFSDLVAVYAECIAFINKQDVSLVTFEDAYAFFLSDLQRYINDNMSVKFKEGEYIQDFFLVAPANRIGYERFILVTNMRLVVTAERKIAEEVFLLENETQPRKIAQEDLKIFLQTNQRLIWFLPTLLKYKWLIGETGGTDVIHDTKYMEKSKLFLGTNGIDLFVWTDEKPLQKITLASIQRFEIVVREVEKKALFITQKIKQAVLLLNCLNEEEVAISDKDRDQVLEFLKRVVKIAE